MEWNVSEKKMSCCMSICRAGYRKKTNIIIQLCALSIHAGCEQGEKCAWWWWWQLCGSHRMPISVHIFCTLIWSIHLFSCTRQLCCLLLLGYQYWYETNQKHDKKKYYKYIRATVDSKNWLNCKAECRWMIVRQEKI